MINGRPLTEALHETRSATAPQTWGPERDTCWTPPITAEIIADALADLESSRGEPSDADALLAYIQQLAESPAGLACPGIAGALMTPDVDGYEFMLGLGYGLAKGLFHRSSPETYSINLESF